MVFSGKHIIITGGSSGIGLATAKELVKLGANLSLIGRNREKLDSAAGELRALISNSTQKIEIGSADVSNKNEITQTINQLINVSGPCDILITSAGFAHPGYFENLDTDIFDKTMQIDYFGTLYAIQAVTPTMMQRKNGSIVAISSGAGLVGVFGYTAYSPAKFAVRGLMECLRQELKPYGIYTGIVYPPDTQTPQVEYENQFKPLETKKISGTIKPISAEKVAKAIVQGIERQKFCITADIQTALLLRIGGLIEPILSSSFDKAVAKARIERGLPPKV